MYRKRINISHVLADQRSGIKEVDEGNRIVRFMQYDIGYFDLEACRAEPVQNPFGPKVLPISPV
jgi:putative transposase